eukprot:scaffold13538_cov72-Cyclotella_meneghiniana.AAC.4
MAAPPPNHAAVVLQSMAAAGHQQRKLFSRPSPLSCLSQAVAGCHLPSIRRQKNIGPLVSALMLMSHPHLPLFPFRQNENIIVSFIDCAPPLLYMHWKWSILL